MTISLSAYLILLLGCGSFLAARAGECANSDHAAATTTKKAGVECVECDIYCALPLQRDANNCPICSCRLPECEGLFPTWCSNTCSSQTCAEFRINGELDKNQCVPQEGDAACEIGCGCPEGEKIEDISSGPWIMCVANKKCGCAYPDAPGGYLKMGYKYKKTELKKVCICGSDSTVDCESDDPRPECPVVNGCRCDVIPDRGGGCPFCPCNYY